MCFCNNNFDVRVRCCPINENRKFLKCEMRIDTMYFNITNGYDIYKKLNNNSYKKVITNYCLKYNMNKYDIRDIIKYYEEDELSYSSSS